MSWQAPQKDDFFPVTTSEMIAEVRRELHYRRRLYPRWVSEGKLPEKTAARRLAIMAAILADLETPKEKT
jgi:hypothetical protein